MRKQDYLGSNIRKNILNLPEAHGIDNIDKFGTAGIFLNLGEAFYPPSPRVIKAIQENAYLVNRYPDNMCTSLREKLSLYVGNGVTPKQIIVGNGSDGLIELLVKVFVDPHDEVVVPSPSFFVYGHATQLVGGRTVEKGRKGAEAGFEIDVDEILENVSDRTRLVFLASPNNPTGNTIERDDIQKILRGVKCMVVVDECYHEICGKTVVDLINEFGNLVVLRSLSKSFALAGLRVGYCIANGDVTAFLYRGDQTFAVNRLALVAAESALEDLEYIQTHIAVMRRDRYILAKELSELGFLVYPSEANFLLVNWGQVFSVNPVERLKKWGIFVSDFHGKQGLQTCFRTAVGSAEENKVLLEALGSLL